MTGDQILGLLLLVVGGFLVGGAISLGRGGGRVGPVVLGLLAALAVVGGVLRLV